MNIFTRREKYVIIIFVVTVLAIIASGVDQQTLNDYEFIWLFFYVVPIGIYIATDPAHRQL